ncbi:hypothetical protein, partial [Streptomyces werraensis]|uniref:hypothetical protein n=1 Tax=Streptomyces werraensis TaxID=68284 RepID=UPI0033B9C822
MARSATKWLERSGGHLVMQAPQIRERSGRSVTIGPAQPGRWAARCASSSAHAERERNTRAQRGAEHQGRYDRVRAAAKETGRA